MVFLGHLNFFRISKYFLDHEYKTSEKNLRWTLETSFPLSRIFPTNIGGAIIDFQKRTPVPLFWRVGLKITESVRDVDKVLKTVGVLIIVHFSTFYKRTWIEIPPSGTWWQQFSKNSLNSGGTMPLISGI